MYELITAAGGSGTETNDLLAAVSTLCGAVIAALVAWASGRGTHPERLHILLEVYRTWPPGLAGKQRIVDAIRLEVAGLRPRNATNRGDMRSDDGHELDLTENEIAHAARHISVGEWWGLGASAAGLAFVVVWMATSGASGLIAETLWGLVAGFAAFFGLTHVVRVVRTRIDKAIVHGRQPTHPLPPNAPP